MEYTHPHNALIGDLARLMWRMDDGALTEDEARDGAGVIQDAIRVIKDEAGGKYHALPACHELPFEYPHPMNCPACRHPWKLIAAPAAEPPNCPGDALHSISYYTFHAVDCPDYGFTAGGGDGECICGLDDAWRDAISLLAAPATPQPEPSEDAVERIKDEITNVAFTAIAIGADPGRLRRMSVECTGRILGLLPAQSEAYYEGFGNGYREGFASERHASAPATPQPEVEE